MGVPLFTIKGSTLFTIKGFAVVGLLSFGGLRKMIGKKNGFAAASPNNLLTITHFSNSRNPKK